MQRGLQEAHHRRLRCVAARLVVAAWALATVFVACESSAATTVYRVNVGGPRIDSTDGGPSWEADTATAPARYLTSPTAQTRLLATALTTLSSSPAPASVLRDARTVAAPGAQAWAFPTPPGEYQVNLYYAEIGPQAQAVNKRLFDVWLEGAQIEDNLDVYKLAGGGYKGIVRSQQVTVFDDQTNMRIVPQTSSALLSGIEVVRVNPPGTWSQLPDEPIARAEASLVQLDGRFYLAGGASNGVSLADQSVYDPSTRTWTRLTPLPEPLNHVQAVAFRGRIYYLGGLYKWPGPWSNHVYIYDPTTDSFSEGAPMPRGRGAGGVAVYGDRIYYAGGLRDTTPVNWFDAYDPVADTWTTMPDMPTAKDHFHAAVVGDRFYAIAGRRYLAGAVVTENVAYDFALGQWVTGLAKAPLARGGFAAVPVGDEIILIGGETRSPNITFRSVQAYNTVTNKWRNLAPMGMSQHGIEAALCGNDVYVAGGSSTIGDKGATQIYAAFSLDDHLDPCVPTTPPTSTSSTTTTQSTTTMTESTTTTTESTTTTEPATTESTTTTEPPP